MLRGLQIESPHIFNIGRILILSWTWALLGSRLLIIQRMSSFVKRQEDNVLSVHNVSSEGDTLPLEIGERWSTKKNWKSHFFLESQQYIHHHEIQEECREFSYHWPVALTAGIWITQYLSNFHDGFKLNPERSKIRNGFVENIQNNQ